MYGWRWPGHSLSWQVRLIRNPWLSLGVHLDHDGPFIDLHLPGVLVRAGRLPDPPPAHRVCKRCRGAGVEP